MMTTTMKCAEKFGVVVSLNMQHATTVNPLDEKLARRLESRNCRQMPSRDR